MPNVNERERAVLMVLAEHFTAFYGDPCYLSFAAIGGERKATRRACRSLARKGLAEFMRGLWNEDGKPCGSGYGATEAGVQYLQATSAARESGRSMDSGTPNKQTSGNPTR